MGKLMRLELFSMSRGRLQRQTTTNVVLDFKSYKGHHTLLFADSYFTSIIGPNGSGKSNSCVPLATTRLAEY
jgi:ABC-type enterochelin transport system ATPase subunit